MYLTSGWDPTGRGGTTSGLLWDSNCRLCRSRLSLSELLHFSLRRWHMEVFWGLILHWLLYRAEPSSFIIRCFLTIYLRCVSVRPVPRSRSYIAIFFFLPKRISLLFCIFFIKHLAGDVILLLLKVGKWWTQITNLVCIFIAFLFMVFLFEFS